MTLDQLAFCRDLPHRATKSTTAPTAANSSRTMLCSTWMWFRGWNGRRTETQAARGEHHRPYFSSTRSSPSPSAGFTSGMRTTPGWGASLPPARLAHQPRAPVHGPSAGRQRKLQERIGFVIDAILNSATIGARLITIEQRRRQADLRGLLGPLPPQRRKGQSRLRTVSTAA